MTPDRAAVYLFSTEWKVSRGKVPEILDLFEL